jgi:hypothetical protein
MKFTSSGINVRVSKTNSCALFTCLYSYVFGGRRSQCGAVGWPINSKIQPDCLKGTLAILVQIKSRKSCYFVVYSTWDGPL